MFLRSYKKRLTNSDFFEHQMFFLLMRFRVIGWVTTIQVSHVMLSCDNDVGYTASKTKHTQLN